jgi:hypothetical protein
MTVAVRVDIEDETIALSIAMISGKSVTDGRD